ncbi:hypothetical protein COBT_002030, partial [Conglomerata obtusa]
MYEKLLFTQNLSLMLKSCLFYHIFYWSIANLKSKYNNIKKKPCKLVFLNRALRSGIDCSGIHRVGRWSKFSRALLYEFKGKIAI